MQHRVDLVAQAAHLFDGHFLHGLGVGLGGLKPSLQHAVKLGVVGLDRLQVLAGLLRALLGNPVLAQDGPGRVGNIEVVGLAKPLVGPVGKLAEVAQGCTNLVLRVVGGPGGVVVHQLVALLGSRGFKVSGRAGLLRSTAGAGLGTGVL